MGKTKDKAAYLFEANCSYFAMATLMMLRFSVLVSKGYLPPEVILVTTFSNFGYFGTCKEIIRSQDMQADF